MKDISLESCADDAFKTLNSCFTRVLNQFAPLMSASNAAKSNSPVWLNNRLEDNQVKRHWKKIRDQTSFNKFQKLRSTFEAELKKSKKPFYTEKFKYSIGDSRQVYKLLNDIKSSNNNTKSLLSTTVQTLVKLTISLMSTSLAWPTSFGSHFPMLHVKQNWKLYNIQCSYERFP